MPSVNRLAGYRLNNRLLSILPLTKQAKGLKINPATKSSQRAETHHRPMGQLQPIALPNQHLRDCARQP